MADTRQRAAELAFGPRHCAEKQLDRRTVFIEERLVRLARGRGQAQARRGAEPIRIPRMGLEPIEDGDAVETEIERLFRARIGGLRRLPRRERAAALRAAREWYLPRGEGPRQVVGIGYR